MENHISVGGTITVHGAYERVTETLRRTLSRPNPAYQACRLLGDDPPLGLAERISFVDENPDGSFSVPRGCIAEVRLAFSAANIEPPPIRDLRTTGEVLPAFHHSLVLRDYQTRGVDSLVRHVQGTVVLPCGAGKTMLALGAIAAVGRSCLVLVHTLDLVEQWYSKLRNDLRLKEEMVAVYSGRKKRVAPITVATIQSLSRASNLSLDSFGLCIHDECHRAPSATSREVLARCPARWRLGLTATPDREDSLSPLATWLFGPVLAEEPVAHLVDSGWLVLPEVLAVYTNFSFSCSPSVPTRKRLNLMRKRVINDPHRTALVCDVVGRESRGHTSLVLSNDKSHCESIRARLEAMGIHAQVITSDTKKKRRREILSALRDGSLGLAIATSLADEGLDVPRLSRVFLALPERARGRTQQRAGRLMRPHGAKRAKLIDFVDGDVPSLSSRWRTRLGVYRALGLKVSETQNLNQAVLAL